MKRFLFFIVFLAAGLTGSGLFLPAARADEAVRVQTLVLQEGWNAVYLEVYPAESNADALFADTPIDLVAFFSAGAQAQFTSDPEAALLQRSGWGIWRSGDSPDSFLNTLTEIQGPHAYLMHAKESFVWAVSGQVVPVSFEWRADSFNFVGCGVDPVSGPTFGQFFKASPAHNHNRIYRLLDQRWQRVSDPNQAPLRSGEAFWIYCDGPSHYQGPLLVGVAARQGVVVGGSPGDIKLQNVTEFPVVPVLHHVPTGPAPVPLAFGIQVVGDAAAPVQSAMQPLPDGPWTQTLPVLNGGQWIKVPLVARRENMRASRQTSLLKITTDWGTETWLPVVGLRPDLEEVE